MSIIKNSRFRSNGHLLTVSLFYERAVSFKKDLNQALFSLKGRTLVNEVTGKNLIDARSTFVELEDPTGYKWATTYLESYEHFKRFEDATWFQEELTEWREEIETKLKARAINVVTQLLLNEDASEGTRLSAAKYLAEQGWEKKSNRGRPSKKEVAANLKRETRKRSVLTDDAERIGLKIVDGGKGA